MKCHEEIMGVWLQFQAMQLSVFYIIHLEFSANLKVEFIIIISHLFLCDLQLPKWLNWSRLYFWLWYGVKFIFVSSVISQMHFTV